MPQTMGTAQDVVAFLTEQHERIKTMFQRVADAAGEEREKAFLQLRRLLAVHETAEEEIVHPLAREALAERGEAVVAERLEEERRAKELLRELEELDADSGEFTALFDQLRGAVLAHARAEEEQEFAAMAEKLDDGELQRMRRAVQFAEKTAPTRPHPGLESAMENMLVGPFAMMLDRARDALSGKDWARVLVRRPIDADSVDVTFIIEAPEAEEAPVSVVGDFNEWDHMRHQFEPGADGRWRVSVEIPAGRSYEFRYLTATGRWFDEPDADDRSGDGEGANSVLSLQ